MPRRPPRSRLFWLWSAPAALLAALPVGALDVLAREPMVVASDGQRLAQNSPNETQAIPAEVQGWFDGAKAASARGEAEEALRLQRRVVAWLEDHPQAPVIFRARALINLGNFLSGVGLGQEALMPTEEAVKLLRPLSASQEDAQKFLAMALNNLGNRLSELGRRQEALAPTEEALKVYRELAKTNPAFLPDLARALNNLGVRLSNLGRRQEALASTEEAVRIRRELAKTNPAFLPDVAMALNNLGYFQLQLDQPEIARNAYEESIDILRPLAASNPAFQDALQRSLNNLEELNRQEGIRTGTFTVVSPTDQTFLPKGDPDTPLRRSVVRLWPTFAGQTAGSGLLGTGFVVRRQGDRAWIATALHVVLANDDRRPPVKLQAELYAGTLPEGLLHPRLDVVLPPSQDRNQSG
ncbi:MAG: tetratricopeptide repeat protein, partial [Cyanobacteriota bacterium]|nr:tetratricopeptide repeat protein [Cyanobacteriota bacterium]